MSVRSGPATWPDPVPSPVAVMAGSGDLPRLIVERLAATGRPHRLLALRGFCDRALARGAVAVHDVLDVRGIEARLKAWRPDAVTLAGGLSRPSAAALMGAFSAYRNRDELAAIVGRGDDNLLRAAIELLETNGLRLVGLRDLAPELLAPSGLYGAVEPEDDDRRAVVVGLSVLGAMSPFDVGQAVVVAGERVLAVEGPEGTDRMLGRVRRRRVWWSRRSEPRRGVLVKAPKHGQDLRVDLPAIGPRTVTHAARAGLAGIVVAAGVSVVLNRRETVEAADRAGLFVIGVDVGSGLGGAARG